MSNVQKIAEEHPAGDEDGVIIRKIKLERPSTQENYFRSLQGTVTTSKSVQPTSNDMMWN